MRPLTLVLGAVLAFSPLAAAAAPAAGGGVAEEARCLITMAAFTRAPDPSTASTAQFGVAYYAGRIKALDPDYDIAGGLRSAAASMKGHVEQAQADRCGALVVAALKELETAQAALAPPARAH